MGIWCVVQSTQAVTIRDTVRAANDNCYSTDATFGRGAATGKIGNNNPEVCDIGLRFTLLKVPQAATIDSAFLFFACGTGTSTATVNANIFFEAVDSADTFSTEANYNGRAVTTAVAWNAIPTWVTETWYYSPNIGTALQEVVNRAGYDSLNSVAVLIKNNSSSGDAKRFMAQWYAGINWAPRLIVYYTAPSPAPSSNVFIRGSVIRGAVIR
jgi:hypothetical protein